MDDRHCEIKIVAFTNQATLYYEEMQIGKCYMIQNGRVNKANPLYARLPNPYEICMNEDTVIKSIPDIPQIPFQKWNFISIESISNVTPGKYVDTIAQIVDIAEPIEIWSRKQNKNITRRLLE